VTIFDKRLAFGDTRRQTQTTMSVQSAFRFTEAIVCRVPDTILPNNNTSGGTPEKSKSGDKKKGKKQEKVANGLGKENSEAFNNIDLIKCRAEYEGLVAVLREIGLDVVELPPDNSFFVGDIAFVLNGMGFVTRPKSPDRQTEVSLYTNPSHHSLQMSLVLAACDELPTLTWPWTSSTV